MKTDLLASRHIGINEQDTHHAFIGCGKKI